MIHYQLKRPYTEGAYDYKAPGKSQVQQMAENMAQSLIGFYTREQNSPADKIKNLNEVVTLLLSRANSLITPNQTLSPTTIETGLLTHSKTFTPTKSSTRIRNTDSRDLHSLWPPYTAFGSPETRLEPMTYSSSDHFSLSTLKGDSLAIAQNRYAFYSTPSYLVYPVIPVLTGMNYGK